jgi:hypothetical protein
VAADQEHWKYPDLVALGIWPGDYRRSGVSYLYVCGICLTWDEGTLQFLLSLVYDIDTEVNSDVLGPVSDSQDLVDCCRCSNLTLTRRIPCVV